MPWWSIRLTARAEYPNRDSKMFHQATSPVIRARNQAMIRTGGEQGRAAVSAAIQRVAGLVVFLGGSPDE